MSLLSTGLGHQQIQRSRCDASLQAVLASGATYTRLNPELDFKWQKEGVELDTKDPQDLQNLSDSALRFLDSEWVERVMLQLRPQLLEVMKDEEPLAAQPAPSAVRSREPLHVGGRAEIVLEGRLLLRTDAGADGHGGASGASLARGAAHRERVQGPRVRHGAPGSRLRHAAIHRHAAAGVERAAGAADPIERRVRAPTRPPASVEGASRGAGPAGRKARACYR